MNCIFRYIVFFFVFLFSVTLCAQNSDSLVVLKNLAEAKQLIVKGETKTVNRKITKAYEIANLNFWTNLKGQASLLLGDLFAQEHQFESSLEQYLKAIQFFTNSNDSESAVNAKLQTAQLYIQFKHYSKALIFYEQVKEAYLKGNKPISSTFWELLAKLSVKEKKYTQAQRYMQRAISQASEFDEKSKLLLLSTEIYIQNNSLDSAMNSVNQGLIFAKNSLTLLIELHNAKAFILKRQGNAQAAGQELKVAIAKLDRLDDANDFKGTLLNNVGVTYTNLESYSNANQYYTEALNFWQKKQNIREVANSYNFLAANYYLTGNLERARNNVQQSIEIAEPNHFYKTLAEAYQIMSLISTTEKEAREYTELQNKTQQLAEKAAQDSEELALAKKLEIENIETEIQARIAAQMDSDRKLQQLALESETRKKDIALKANELTLLKKEGELRDIELKNKELERQRVKQLLEVTKTNALAEELKRKEEIQKLKIQQQEANQKEREQQIALLENEKSLQQLQIKEQANFKRNGLIVFFLIVLILIGVVYSLYMSRKHQKSLRKQKEQIEIQSTYLRDAHNEILVQNEELTQFQEELTIQRDNLAKRNVEIDKQNKKVAQSIRSATIIQSAILLPDNQIAALLKEYFILFRPKDNVSGDFYWIAQAHGYKFVAAVDCTGHGVPGALMSLIGNSILNKIVKIGGETDPGIILTQMHQEVYEELKQESTGNADGMDMAIVSFFEKDGECIVKFAGAKRPLHYVEKGSEKLVEIEADRMSIGGKAKKERNFATKTLRIPKGSSLYLSSDGYSDQNDVNRKRFSNGRYVELIKQVHGLSLDKQKQEFEKALDKQMEKTEQRDDILVIGFKV